MKSTMMTKQLTWIAATITLASLGIGCATDKSEPKDFIQPVDSTRKTNQFIAVQSANGAKDDATLQPFHFTGSKLNSLGQDKLALMLPDGPDGDVAVYVNLPAGSELTSARRDDVMAHLKSMGLEESHIKIHDGPNADLSHPAAEGLKGLPRTETGTTSAQADAADNSMNLGGGSSGGGSSSSSGMSSK
jgi:uncharacterized membrane protein YgcG